MLRLTRLNSHPFVLNVDAILYIDSTPDTIITLTNGDHLPVLESIEEILEQANRYERGIRSIAPPSPRGNGT